MADLAYALEVAKPDCVADDFGCEIVALNCATGMYFSLTDLAAAIWRDLAAGHSVQSIISELSSINGRVADATAKFVNDIERAGLMRRTNPHPVERAAPESAALVSTGETRLTMQSFEDMKDLILADPIHEADHQVGWPLPRTDIM